MGLILTKIQYVRSASSDLVSGETPYYEYEGRLYLKSTGEEITIQEEGEILLDDFIGGNYGPQE